MSTQTNDPVLNLFDEITAAVREVDEATQAGESAKQTGHAKTYHALTLALRLHRVANTAPEAKAQLDQLYAERRIKPPRKDANPFTRLAKLCFPDRTAGDYSRYASVLLYAQQCEMDEDALEAELGDCGLTLLAQIAKTVQQGESRSESEIREKNEGLHILEKWGELATIDLPLNAEVGTALLVRRIDGGVDVHYHPALDDADEAWKRVRKIARRKLAPWK